MKKPIKLVRALKWERRERDYPDLRPAARFTVRTPSLNARHLTGSVGATLLEKGPSGKVTFLDQAPFWPGGHLMVVGVRTGILVSWWTNDLTPVTEFVTMCARFRDRIVGLGKIRWAKVKATA